MPAGLSSTLLLCQFDKISTVRIRPSTVFKWNYIGPVGLV